MPDYLELLRGLMAALGPREAEAKMLPMDDRASRMIKLQREAQAPESGSPEDEDPLTRRWYSPERREMHRLIGQATEAHPSTVEVAAPEAWPKKDVGYAGIYDPRRDRIDMAPRSQEHFPINAMTIGDSQEMVFTHPSGYDPALVPMLLSAAPMQDTLAHEQLHFLMDKLIAAEADERKARITGMSVPELLRLHVQGGAPSTGTQQAFSTDEMQHALIAYLLGTGSSQSILRKDTVPEPMTVPAPQPTTPEMADAYRRLIYQIFPDEARRTRALAGLGAPRAGTLLETLRSGSDDEAPWFAGGTAGLEEVR